MESGVINMFTNFRGGVACCGDCKVYSTLKYIIVSGFLDGSLIFFLAWDQQIA